MHELGKRPRTEQEIVSRVGELIGYDFPRLTDLAGYEPDEKLFSDGDALHGMEHAAGTLSMYEFLRRLPQFRELPFYDDEMREAAVHHDIGRSKFLPPRDHGNRGAERVAGVLQQKEKSSASIALVQRLIRAHVPGALVDPEIPPFHQSLFKEADKIELARVVPHGIAIDRRKFTFPESYEIFLPFAAAVYQRVDRIKDSLGVNGFRAYLLAEVELGVVNPR